MASINDLHPEALRVIFRQAYMSWQTSLGKYGQIAKRAIAAWQAIETWTAAYHVPTRQSLGPPATEAQLDAAEQRLGCELPASVRVLYLLHNGQNLACDAAFPDLTPDESMFHGLPGGYSFYDHVACTRLLSLDRLVWATLENRSSSDSGLVVASAVLVKKRFVLSNKGTRLVVSSAEAGHYWNAIAPGGDNALLRWLEAFVQALQQQRFSISKLVSSFPHIKGINLFPVKEPWQRSAVTRGVKVQATSIFVPEKSLPEALYSEQSQAYSFFSYCVTFSLLPLEEQREVWPATAGPFRPITCVQLKSRHWIMRGSTGGVLQEVKGEGVIGEYPILRPGAEPYEYQSCTHQHDGKGSMEGSFEFVEGTLSNPTGGFFDVECPRFMLERPEAIF